MLRASEFKNKEVINLINNEKLGYISDFEICTSNGEIAAIIVPEKSKSIFNVKNKDYRIPWGAVSGIGEDIITVNIEYPEP